MSRIYQLVIVLLATCTGAAVAQPQTPLADRVPAGSLLYVGWAGTEDLSARYGGTKTEALLAKSNLPEAFGEYLPELLDALAREEPDARPFVDFAKQVGSVMVTKPWAFAFGGVDFNSELNDGDPLPRLIFVCEAGDQAGELRAALTGFLTDIGTPELVTLVREDAGFVYMALGYNDLDLAELAAAGGASLANAESFSNGVGSLGDGFQQGTLMSFFVDLPATLWFIEEAMLADGIQEREFRQFQQAMDVSGLRSLGVIAASAGFENNDFVQSSFLGLNGEPEGLLRLLPAPGEGLAPQTLARVPLDATVVAATRFELDELLPLVRTVVQTFDPESAGQVEQGLTFANMFAGANVEEDVLNQLSGSWAAFISPSTGQDIIAGVVTHTPDDPAKLSRALRSMSLNLSSIGNAQLRQETDGLVSIPGRSLQRDGIEWLILNTPVLAPTWGMTGDSLTLALNPQTAIASNTVAGGFGESAAVASLMSLADGNTPMSISYADLPAMAPATYPGFLALDQLAFGLGDLFGDYLRTKPPVAVFPTLPDVMNHLSPSMAVAWVDDQGYHARSVEPFPLSGLLVNYGTTGSQISQLAGLLGQASVLAPSLGRSREAANKVRSASNLRQIGQRAVEHAIHDRQGSRFPPDLQTLVITRGLPAELFVNPRGNTVAPAGLDPAAAGEWAAEEGDYVYLGGGLGGTAGPLVLLAYENPDVFDYEDGLNVLFADGHVRFARFDEFARVAQFHREVRLKADAPLDPALDEMLRRHVKVGVRQSQ